MSALLRIRWTIAPKTAPRPLINCNRCGGTKPYQCSEKFRVNANGKRIDAWLIYRCINCENSWNFGILERCNRRDIEPALLAALESNDPALARRHAFDTTAIRSRIGRVEEFSEVAVRKQVLDGGQENTVALELQLELEMPTSLRLDRLLAVELGISRSRLQVWEDKRLLVVAPEGPRPCAGRPARAR
ncbi:DUF1062 domain-containing protein [Mesorhizobium sp. STM 4661]|uniref:DUF1062 domain-containing protein n=1 Tax=Mesorhizobium sp. STM 4661 TaxID=1297570 RepID=UPI0002C01737|nr:DUF1062 domain-containing protein [Mesorhizobium sp. STM 4661]CCV10811.1 conserved hypothetical protein [Mesorhizobium sp. STM 4661]